MNVQQKLRCGRIWNFDFLIDTIWNKNEKKSNKSTPDEAIKTLCCFILHG